MIVFEAPVNFSVLADEAQFKARIEFRSDRRNFGEEISERLFEELAVRPSREFSQIRRLEVEVIAHYFATSGEEACNERLCISIALARSAAKSLLSGLSAEEIRNSEIASLI